MDSGGHYWTQEQDTTCYDLSGYPAPGMSTTHGTIFVLFCLVSVYTHTHGTNNIHELQQLCPEALIIAEWAIVFTIYKLNFMMQNWKSAKQFSVRTIIINRLAVRTWLIITLLAACLMSCSYDKLFSFLSKALRCCWLFWRWRLSRPKYSPQVRN